LRVLVGAALVAALAGPAEAQVEPGIGGDPSSRARYPTEGPEGQLFLDVARDLRCPTCTGLSVVDSDAQFSVQIKDIVKEQVEAGKSKAEILDYFTTRYGPWILRAPPKRGFNALAWVLPIALLILGPALVWALVWRQRRQVSMHGVRPAADILAELDGRLAEARAKLAQGGLA
jgi:cytochrome c-type biogenesis protein CcmH